MIIKGLSVWVLFITTSINYSILAFWTSPVGLFEKVEQNHGAGSDEEHLEEDH